METILKPGFTYTLDFIKNGVVIASETVHNLMPYEGMAHLINTAMKSGAQVTQWYIGLIENDYTPTLNTTMANLSVGAVECTAYSETERVPFIPGAIASGAVDNYASPAEFNITAAKTIYGGFITSSSTKGGSAGVLLSVVKLATAKSVDSGTVIRVRASFQFTSV